MSKDFNNIKQWILPKLEQMEMSIEQFANLAGITRTAVYNYLNDRNRPSTQTMARMCEVLGVPLLEGLQQYSEKKAGRPYGWRKKR